MSKLLRSVQVAFAVSLTATITLLPMYLISSTSSGHTERSRARSASSPTVFYSTRAEDWVIHGISSGGSGADGVRLADVNADGLQDVVSAFEGSGEVRIFQHPGYENLDEPHWPSVTVGNVARGEDAFAFDFNGDGNADVVSSHEGDTLGIYFHWAPSDSDEYWDPNAWDSNNLLRDSHGHGWMFAIPLDVNLDGRTDLLAGSKDDYFNDRNSVGELAWFEAPAEDQKDLKNWTYHSIDHVGWTMSIIPMDINADGFPDLIVTDRNADPEHMGARWLENPGGDWDEPWSSNFLGDLMGTRPTFMDTGDLDGDGNAELVIPVPDETRIAILSPDGSGNPGSYVQTNLDLANGDLGLKKAAGISDADSDGQPDIVITFVAGKIGAGWLSYSGSPFSGTWVFHTIYEAEGSKMDLVAFDDVDGDGDLDLLTTEERLHLEVIWFENPSK
jgi:hypothetical protein